MAMHPVTGAAITAYFSKGDWDGYCQVSFTTVDRINCFYRIEYHQVGDPPTTWTFFGDYPWEGVFYGVSVKFANASAGGGPRRRTVDQIRITTTDLNEPPDTPAIVIVTTPTDVTSIYHEHAHNFYRSTHGELGALKGSMNVLWQDLSKFIANGRITLEKNGLTSPETQTLIDTNYTSSTFGDHTNFAYCPFDLLPPGIPIPVDQNGQAYWDVLDPPTNIDPNVSKLWVAEGDLLIFTLTTNVPNSGSPGGMDTMTTVFTTRYYHAAHFYQFADVATKGQPYSKQCEVIQDQWNPTPIVATIADFWNQLPAGLTVSPTGLISGTPTTTGWFAIQLFCYGLGLTNNGEEIYIRVNLVGAPVMKGPSPSVLPLVYGVPYPQQYSCYATNHPTSDPSGTPKAYRITVGTLPHGLTLNGDNGIISGVPDTVEAAHNVTFVAHNIVADSAPFTVTFSVTLFDPPQITSPAVVVIFLDEMVTNYHITTNIPALNYRAYDLPAGLALIGPVLTGKPQVPPGVYQVSLQANNQWGWGPIFILSITVGVEAPVITSPLVVSTLINDPFFYQITASHSPVSYGASGLPPGLSINSTLGQITGVPTAPGTAIPITLTATNAGDSGTALLLLDVVLPPAPVIDTTATHGRAITAESGVTYESIYTATASHNPTNWTWSALPEGITAAMLPDPTPGATGTALRIGGTFHSGGLFSIALTAYNLGGPSDVATFYFLVTIGPTVAETINQLGTIMEIWVDLNAATVGIGNSSTVDEQGVVIIPTGTALQLKRGDTQEIFIIFYELEGTVPVPADVSLTSLKFGVKPTYDDEFIVYTETWDGAGGRFRIYPDFSGTNDDLDAVLVQPSTTLLTEIQWEMLDDQGNTIRRSSVVFNTNILRDLIHPD